MSEVIHTAIYYFCAAIVWICLGIAAVKIIWNIGLPYAMLREKPRGWSIFPLIEIVPVAIAAFTSWMIVYDRILSASHILTYGLGAIVLSYLHLCLVSFIVGILAWIQSRNKK